jgi:hypothetical protein
MWKLKGLRKGAERGRCPLREEEMTASHILLKCKELKRWRVTILQQEMSTNKRKKTAYRKLIRNNTTLELDSLNKCLYKMKCKKENKIEKLVHIGEEEVL